MELQVTNFAFWGPLDEERAQVGSFLHSANHSGMVRGPTHHAQDDTGCDQNAELGMIAHAANANDFGCPHCRGGAFAILQLVLETDTHTGAFVAIVLQFCSLAAPPVEGCAATLTKTSLCHSGQNHQFGESGWSWESGFSTA